MTSFGAPQLRSEEDRWRSTLQSTLRTAQLSPSVPEVKTEVQKQEIEEALLDQEVGFGTKILNAITEETVTGRGIQTLSLPSFPETGYYPSDEDIKEYASDLSEETIKRIRDGETVAGIPLYDGVKSFEEFIYTVRDARETERKRRQLFSGGAGGFAEGLTLSMLTSGVEAALVGWLATMATGGTAAPAAVTETAATVAATTNRAFRIRQGLKAAGIAAAIDIPLEGIRYGVDKTITTNMLITNWVASVGLGGALGTAFPNMYLSPMQRAARDAQLEDAAQAAAKSGDEATAAALRSQKSPKSRAVARDIVDQKDPLERVMNMSVREVREEAVKRGIRITTKDVKKQVTRKRRRSNRKIEQVREDLIAAMRKEAAELSERGVEAVGRQVDNMWARLAKRVDAAKAAVRHRRYAEALGVTGSVLERGGLALKEAAKKAAIQAAQKGYVVSGQIGKPKGIKFGFTATIDKVKYQLAGNMERMLWKLANDKGKKAAQNKQAITRYLREQGVEDPQKLAAEFDAKVRQEISEQLSRKSDDVSGLVGPPIQPGEYVADISRMELESAVRILPDGTRLQAGKGQPFVGEAKPVRVKVDNELLEIGPPKPKKTSDDPLDVDDIDPDAPEAVVLDSNGEKLAAGDADDFVGFDADLGADATVPARNRNVATDTGRIGGRRAIARGVEKVFDVVTLGMFNPIIYRFMNSQSLAVRRFAAVFMDNPQGGGPSSVSAIATANFQKVVGKLQQAFGEAGREAAKQRRVLTDSELIRLVRSNVDEADLDAPEAIAVKGIRTFFKDLLEYGKANGLPMDNIPDAADYFVRKWNPSKYRSVVDKLGGGEAGRTKLAQFLGRAIRAKVPDKGKKALTEKKSEKVAARILEYIENPEKKVATAGSITTVQGLKKQLAKELQDVEEGALAEIGGVDGIAEDLINLIARNHADEMNLSFGRRRIAMDELYEETIDGVTVRVDDLLDMDLNMLTRSYAQKLIGAVAVRKGFGAAFGDEGMSLIDAKSAILRASRDAGDSEKSAKLYQKSVDQIYKMMLGIPMYNATAMKFAMMSNALAQSTMGMTLGFAQVPEIANIFHRTTFGAALRQFPSLREIRGNFGMMFRRNPRMRNEANEFSSCLECFTAVGGDFARGDHFIRRMDDIGFDSDWVKTQMGKYMDAGRLFATINPLGVMPMDTFLRRWAARASFQHIVNQAYKVQKNGKVTLSKGFWRNARERFAQMGLKEEDFQRLSKVLTNPDYVKVKKGRFGGYKVLDFDLSKADDQAIVDKLVMAIRRNSDSLVQRQSYGEMPWWMHTEVGKILGQFRTFVSVAKSKQVIAGLARGDIHEATNVVSSGALATLGYMAQTYYRSLGKDDPERYYEERTSDENLVKNAFARNGYATVLPMLMDGVSTFLGFGGIIDPSARTTGQALDPVFGSTAVSNYVRLQDLLKSSGELLGSLFTGQEFTQDDYRNLQSLVWITKIPIIDQLINRNLIPLAPESN